MQQKQSLMEAIEVWETAQRHMHTYLIRIPLPSRLLLTPASDDKAGLRVGWGPPTLPAHSIDLTRAAETFINLKIAKLRRELQKLEESHET